MREAIHEAMEIKDLKDMLEKTEELYADRPAFIYKVDDSDEFKEITHKEFRNDIKALGTELVARGLKDKRIAIISENRYEWCVAYLAVATGTGVVVPLDRALPGNEIENLIKRSEVEAIFYSEKYNDVMNKIKEKGSTKIKYFISMDEKKEKKGIYSQSQLIKEGNKKIKKGNREFLCYLIKISVQT